MHHKGTVKIDGKVPGKPFFGGCSCGPQGNFATSEEARQYVGMHLKKLGGVSTVEFVDETIPPVPPVPQPAPQPAPAPVPKKEVAPVPPKGKE